MTARHRYHHGDLRDALVRAALELIAERGPAALSVAEAARRTGVSGGAPYRHFSSRQSLLAAAATAVARLLHAELRAAVAAVDRAGLSDDHAWAVAALGATAHACVRFTTRHRVGVDLVFNPELAGTDDTELVAASRAVVDVLLPLAAAVTGHDMPAALRLLERHLVTAHGYATLQLAGFFRARDRDLAGAAAAVVRDLATSGLTCADA
jgi:AcrR family transcriptional regulator